MWPAGAHVYWITSTSFVFLQSTVLRHPKVVKMINPTFYEDMQKVFHSERNKEDSERYIEKLKNCEDAVGRAPKSTNNVVKELKFELSKMKTMSKALKFKYAISYLKDKAKPK